MAQKFFKIEKGAKIIPSSTNDTSQAGDLQAVSGATTELVYHNGSVTATVVTNSNTLTLSNKTLASPTATGTAQINGALAVTGASDLAAVSADSLALTGALNVDGASDLAAVSADSLSLTGNAIIGGAVTGGAANFSSVTASGSILSGNTLQASTAVTAPSGLFAHVSASASLTAGTGVFANDLSVSGAITSAGAIVGASLGATVGAAITGFLSVTGNTDLTAVTATSLLVNGNASATGTLSASGEIRSESDIRHKLLSSAPATPATGYTVSYFKTDGRFYGKNSAGTEFLLGAGAFILNGSRGSPVAIAASAGYTFLGNQRELAFIQGSGGPVSVTAANQVSNGTDVGQELVLMGRSDTNTVELSNGNNLELNGNIVLGESDSLSLVWDGTNWIELSRNI